MHSAFFGKVAVVTGAGSSVGRALAVQLADAGALLALSDIEASALTQTMRLLPPGAQARGYKLDVRSREAVLAHADDVQRDFGTAHFVFNNAGATRVNRSPRSTSDEVEQQLGINRWGVIYGSKAFLPMMLMQREGCIVNISGCFGLTGAPAGRACDDSKFGVRGFTEGLWRPLEGTGVRAVSVHSGVMEASISALGRRYRQTEETATGFLPLAIRIATASPDDCAAAVLKGVRRGKKCITTGSRYAPPMWLSRMSVATRGVEIGECRSGRLLNCESPTT